MEIILVRHGESKANRNNQKDHKMYTGQLDWGLTLKGRIQAHKLKGLDIFNGVEKCFVSPLKRTKQTASYFCPKDKTVYDKRLLERSLGDFEGHLVEEIKSKKEYEKYFKDPKYNTFMRSFTARAPHGENFQDVVERCKDFLNEVFSKNYKKIVIVSHHDCINCILHVLLKRSEEETLQEVIKKCEPIILNIEGIK